MQDLKKHIETKINDIDEMLNDLDMLKDNASGNESLDNQIDINQLDVVDVLHNILN